MEKEAAAKIPKCREQAVSGFREEPCQAHVVEGNASDEAMNSQVAGQ